MNKVIGFSGMSGSGKTTLVRALSEQLQVASLHWDDFDELSRFPEDYLEWFEQGQDYTAFNYEELANALLTLKSNKEYTHPTLHKIIQPSYLILADLPLGRMHTQTAQYVDLFIHINVPLDVALCRRIIRDHKDIETLITELNDYLTKYRKLFPMEDVKQASDKQLDGSLELNAMMTGSMTILKAENCLDKS